MVGMDFLGSIEPVADNGSKYILIIVDYCRMGKWDQFWEELN